MSLFSVIIKPQIEKELQAIEPQLASFLIVQAKNIAAEFVEWAESRINVDLNGDGKIG